MIAGTAEFVFIRHLNCHHKQFILNLSQASTEIFFEKFCVKTGKSVMSEFGTDNLIDLSVDGEITSNPEIVDEDKAVSCFVQLNCTSVRDSLENNPFDKAFKQMGLLSDPFESVCQEAQNFPNTTGIYVETGCLISLPENDCKNTHGDVLRDQNTETLPVPKFSRMGSANSYRFSSISSINSINSASDIDVFSFDSPIKNLVVSNQENTLNKGVLNDFSINNNDDQLLNSMDSLPISKKVEISETSELNKAFIKDSITLKCNDNSTDQFTDFSNSYQPSEKVEDNISRMSDGNICGLKGSESENSLNGSLDNRLSKKKDNYKLLKLSLTNSALAPARSSGNADNFEQSVFSEAKELAEKFSHLLTDSPKDDSCDDLMAIKPNWLDSETDVDSDLETLKIPMLEKIEDVLKNAKLCQVNEPVEVLSEDCNKKSSRRSLDLKAIKERIELEKGKNNANAPDVNGLIESLKKIVFECSNDNKKNEASNLLESLSDILAQRNEQKGNSFLQIPSPPQIIMRQGTFDIDKSSGNSGKQDDIKSATELHQRPLATSPIQAKMPDIIEQIGKLFGNENINVVQANLGSPSEGSNPTYIVVMGTPVQPVRQATHIYSTDGDGSPEFSNSEIRRRSQSWSLRDKSMLGGSKLKASPSRDFSKTPCNTTRRKSFSASSRESSLSNIRRSIYGSNSKNCGGTPLKKNLQNNSKKALLETHQEVNTPPINRNIKPDVIPKNLKLKSSELVPKVRGPLKAMILGKKLVPMVVASSVSSPIEDKRKPKAITSTPVIGNSRKGVPNACSTPTLAQFNVSPEKNISKARKRYSYASATPKPRSNLCTISRRRSLSEIKSPKKRLDCVKETATGKIQIKSVKIPQDFVKNASKMAPVKPTKPIKRESLPGKNKENKIPRAAN